MPRYIDADAIPWFIEGVGDIPVITKEEVDNMPETLVRCKDCKWYSPYPYSNGGVCGVHAYVLRPSFSRRVKDDDYCSWAERKERWTYTL